ncbi:glycosyltransferase family 4 protein [Bacillus salipaludis]|uniref:glycosyltransferase n=1 Tax=Bacillus salipaludis TaxID=2547811 RepID=UPI002E23DA1D|nr:glycosyltransferase family 4 protein [Bacillus salipaludis]
MELKKHLLIYDVDWWVLGKHAKIVKQFHPLLEIMSLGELSQVLAERGSEYVNNNYTVISTMCLTIAQMLFSSGVRVDSSVAVSNYCLVANHDTYREWEKRPIMDYSFIHEYVQKIKAIGAINSTITNLISIASPTTNVKYMKQFVDTNHFIPLDVNKDKDHFVIGWVGDTEKYCKNYYSVYLKIVEAFNGHPQIRFKEATLKNMIPQSDMPAFYNSLDLLVITGDHEGGPAPVLEAYACGIPVLSTNIGYVKDVTPPAASDFILNTNDSNFFIYKINKLLEKKNELKELGRILREHVNEHFSKDIAVKDWIAQLFYFDQ